MKITIPAWILICFYLFLTPPAINAAPSAVDITGESLTLDVKDAPLRTVLEEVTRQGIRVRIDPNINPLITASFTGRPLNSAFSAILKKYSYSLIWDSPAVTPSQELRLSEIQIFRQGRKDRMRLMRPPNTLDITQGKDGTFHVRNSLLVRLEATASTSTLALLHDRFGATPVDFNGELGFVRLHLPDGANPTELATIISELPGIAFAEPDYAYPLAVNRSTQAPPQPATETPAARTPLPGNVVAVLDSGLSENWAESPFMTGSFDAISPGATISDPLGHGTQMSLIAAGLVRPMGRFIDPSEKNTVVSIRAFDDNGFTSNSALLQGIDYAIEADARVLSMSWGTETKSQMLESAVQYAADRGLILVAAAGNSPSGVPVYPAAYDTVIGVGALMPDGTVWQDSNHGDFVSIYAPGLADLPVGHDGDPGTYAGTSIATAYAAHQIAKTLAAMPDADTNTLLQALVSERSNGISQ